MPGMNYDIPDAVAETAHWQAGTLSRRQLLDAGLTSQMIATRLERERWQVLYRGVYALFSGPPPRAAWLWAAVLRAGDGAVLSHHTAAELHGLIESPAETIYVTVPSTRRVRTLGIAIRISGHPCETALWQARLLRQRGWPGTPIPCSAGCPVGRGWQAPGAA